MYIFFCSSLIRALTKLTSPTIGRGVFRWLQVCAKVNDVQIQSVPLTPDFDVVVSEVSEIVLDPDNVFFFFLSSCASYNILFQPIK